MEEADRPVIETAPDDGDQTGSRVASPVLIYIGSAEDQFSGAGHTTSLDGIHRVVFGRSPTPGQIEITRDRGVLLVGVPTMWASSTHAELTLNPPGTPVEQEVRDLGSRNGTIVEGKTIADITALAPGQVLEIGRSFWMVRRYPSPIPDDECTGEFDPTGTASPAMRHLQRALARLSGGQVPILLVGETGCGKEHLARAIHRASERDGAFVRTTLAGAPPARVDALLFGSDDRGGAIGRAAGGTLFIDDVSDLSLEVQSKLLWGLTEHPARGVDGGGGVRLISGSLRELAPMVASRRFRADLYSRLAGYEARLLSLRERREDLGLLTRALLEPRPSEGPGLETAAFRRLLGHSWPFNVRELSQCLAAAASLSGGPSCPIERAALNEVLREDDGVPRSADGIRAMRQELVRQLVAFDGDPDAVAANFGVDMAQIDRWLERFDISPDQYRGLS